MNRVGKIVYKGWMRNAEVNLEYCKEQRDKSKGKETEFWENEIKEWLNTIEAYKERYKILEAIQNEQQSNGNI